MKLSLIVPCFNEEKNLAPLFEATLSAFRHLPEEIDGWDVVFVDDGSRDGTWREIEALYAAHPDRLSAVRFPRNFGKEAALYAGLSRAGGDLCCFMDADLQQRPEVVVQMAEYLLSHPETDVVAAYDADKKEGRFRRFCRRRFYRWMGAGDAKPIPGASDFRLFRRKVADALLSMDEYFRFTKGMFAWMGFETYAMPYTAEKRHAGESKWPLRKLLRYGLDGVLSFSTFPLQLSIWLGLFVSFCSLVYMIVVIVQKLAFGIDVPGYATLVVLTLLLSGIQLLMLGVIGEYLAKTYLQTKNRPLYVEKDRLDKKD